MKKHLIAAAVAGALAVPAMAQVTVYGILDMGYVAHEVTNADTKVETTAFNAGKSGLSGSRLGFKGEEDLGGGMKAGFIVETGISTNGAALLSGTNRAANVSLSGGFGTIVLGRQNTPGKVVLDSYTAFGGGGSYAIGSAAFEASANASGVTLNTTAKALAPTRDRATDAVSYATPDIGGLKVTAAYIKSTTDTSATVGDAGTDGYAVMAGYSAGPVKFHVAYTDLSTSAEGSTLDNEHKHTAVGASMGFGAATAYVAFADGEYKVAGGTALDSMGWDVGLKYGMGNTTLVASMGQGESDVAVGTKREFDAYYVQLHQALSKRTTVYAIHGMTDYDTVTGSTAKNEAAVTMIGVRHSF